MILTREGVTPVVYLDGQPSDGLSLVRARHGVSGRDEATIAVNPFIRKGHPVIDFALSENRNRVIEVRALIGGEEKVLHWGKISVDGPSLDERGEARLLVSRTERHHFGVPLEKSYFADDDAGPGELGIGPLPSALIAAVDTPPVFNPQVDGEILPNRSTNRRQQGGSNHVFLHHESSRTVTAQDQQQDEPALWTLAQVVHYFCWTLNSEQEHILNPTIAEIEAAIVTNNDQVKNLSVRKGLYLPEILDRILHPYGYGWCVQYGIPGVRLLVVFKRGKGLKTVSVKLQRPGEVPDTTQSNVSQMRPSMNVANLANIIYADGDFVEVESTFTLKPAWNKNNDSLGWEYVKDLGTGAYEEELQVYRKFVLNEAADYNDLAGREYERFDMNTVFDHTKFIQVADFHPLPGLHIRRRFYQTITTMLDGSTPKGPHNGYLVEFKDGSSSYSDWTPIDRLGGMTPSVLRRECGVMLPLNKYVADQFEDGQNFELRITATVRADVRLHYRTERSPTSVNSDDVELYLDLSDRFHYRQIHEDSRYASSVKDGTLKSRQTDDLEKLKSYCDDLRDAWDVARVTGSLTLEGLDWVKEYQPGYAVSKVDGRNVSFNGKAGGQPKYPLITSVTYDANAQKTGLSLETFRDEVAVP